MISKPTLLALLLINGLLAAIATTAWILLPRSYESNFVLAVPQASGALNTSFGNVNQDQEQSGFTPQVDPRMLQKQILLSDAVLAKLKAPISNEKLRSAIKVKPEEMSNILLVKVTDHTAESVHRRSEKLIAAYRSRIDELRHSDYQERQALYGKLLQNAAAELEQAEVNLARFKSKSGLVANDEQTKTTLEAIGNLIKVQEETNASAHEAQARAQTLATRIGMTPMQAVRSLRLTNYPPYVNARSQLDEIERSLSEARALYTDENPRVKDLLNRRLQLQALVQERINEATAQGADGSLDTTRMELIGKMIAAEAESEAMGQGATNIQSRIDALETKMRNLGPSQVELVRYQRRFLVAEVTFNALTSQAQQARLDMFVRYPNVQVIDGPSLPEEPSFPRLPLIAGGAIGAGLLASLALILRARSLDPPLFESDLPSLDAQILAQIPELHPPSPVNFFMLAALLRPELKVLLVTSSTAGEGKSLITTYLAAALGQWGRRVLVIDADFSKEFSIPEVPVFDLPVHLDRLDVAVEQVKASNLGELRNLVKQNRNLYDLILVDTGPLQLTADAVSILKVVPDVLFVMRRGYVSKPLAQSSLRFLRQVNANLVGCVLNGARDLTANGRESYRRYPTRSKLPV
jgi:polysaccharide biosynthesis transport protein